ncbi:MAG: MOP flippase family protein [Nitrospirota bacterium]
MERVKIENISLKSRVVNAVLWLGITKLLGQVLSWVITIYVVRILAPEDYGLMGMAGVFIGFVILFNELGLGSAIIHKKKLAEDDISNIFWLVFLLNVALYLLSFFLLSPLIAGFFNEPRLIAIIRVIAINMIISSFGFISYNMLTKDLIFSRRSQAEFIGNLSGGIATFLFAMNGFGVWSLVYGSIILTAVTNLLFYIYYPWRPGFSFSFSKIKEMFNFGLKVAIARFLWYVYTNSDSLMAGKLLGKTALGYYSLAFQFASIPLDKIVSLVTQIAFPAFSEIQDDAERLKSYFVKIIRFIAFITFPLFCGIFLVADDAVILFLTEKWRPIIIPLKVLCIVSTLRAVNAMNIPLALAKGRGNIAIFSNLLFATALPLGFYIGSFYGLDGFAYSWLIVFPFLFAALTVITLNIINLSIAEYSKAIMHPATATVLMVVSVLLLKEFALRDVNKIISILGTMTLSVSAYFIYFLLFNSEILSEIKTIFRRQTQ